MDTCHGYLPWTIDMDMDTCHAFLPWMPSIVMQA